eukprot:3164444-Prymnesium_polylepis.1
MSAYCNKLCLRCAQLGAGWHPFVTVSVCFQKERKSGSLRWGGAQAHEFGKDPIPPKLILVSMLIG